MQTEMDGKMRNPATGKIIKSSNNAILYQKSRIILSGGKLEVSINMQREGTDFHRRSMLDSTVL